MSNFVVKVYSSYKIEIQANPDERCSKSGLRPDMAKQVQIIAADQVNVRTLSDKSIVEVWNGPSVTNFHLEGSSIKRDEWMRDGGIIEGIYIENERGKTVHSLRRSVDPQ